MKIYLKTVRLNFPVGSTIGVIVDRATSHEGDIMKWVDDQNKMDKSGTSIVLEYIDKSLTAIYQPCDVVINKPLKQQIRKNYLRHASQTKTKPGEYFVISREKLVEFIESSYKSLNKEMYEKQIIKNSFEKCGLNPHFGDTMFRKYLSGLEECSVYNALSQYNAGIELGD